MPKKGGNSMVKHVVKNHKLLAVFGGLLVFVLLMSVCGGGGDSQPKPTAQPTEPAEPEKVSDEVTDQNDANSGGDVPADLASPYRIEANTKYTGVLDESDDGDAYMVSYNPGDVACIKLVPSKGLDLGVMCAEFVANDGVRGEAENLCVGADIAKAHITRLDIMVGGVAGAGNYSIEVTMTPQNDGNSGTDAGENDENVVKLEPGTYPHCRLGYGDQSDIYKVSRDPGQHITVIAKPSADFDIRFWEWESDREYNSGVKGEEEKIESDREISRTEFYTFSVNTVGESRTPGTYTLKVTVE
jgi:hypothetical protein